MTLVAGEEASGLANMVGQYLEQLLADEPAKRSEAAAVRGRLGLRARPDGRPLRASASGRESDVAVTVVFGDNGIAIEEGLRAPDVVISGPIETLMHVLAGKASPAWELCRRRLTVRPTLRRPLFGHQAYRLMRLPGVRPWSGLPPGVIVAVVGATAVATFLLVRHVRQRGRGGEDG